MNLIDPLLAVSERGQQAPPMLIIIFWILLILCFLGNIGVGFVAADNPNRGWITHGSGIVSIILFAILGYYTFGF